MPKIHQSTELTEYDGTTGEITKQTTSNVISWGAEPDYIKLYLQDILYLSDMPTQYTAALMALLRRTSYAGDEYGMCVVLVPAIKDQICKELGLQKRQSLDNILNKLVKGKILFRVERGMYRLNPYLFGRGTWSDIAKIRMDVTYTPGEGRTFQAVIDKAYADARAKRDTPAQGADATDSNATTDNPEKTDGDTSTCEEKEAS